MSDSDRPDRFIPQGYTFDDVLMVPAYSDVHPRDTSVTTRLTATIELSIPLLSAAMDTVTESRMAIAIAREGGLGVIHKNMPIDRQASEVDRVKRSESGMIQNPYTLGPDRPIREARRLMESRGVSGVPVVDEAGRVLGIITNRDLLFETDGSRPIADVMTAEELVTAPAGTTLDEAEAMLQTMQWPGNIRQLRNVIERLLILGEGTGPIEPRELPGREVAPEGDGRLVLGGALATLPLREARELFEKEYLLTQINRFGGNISRTANFVGMERSALHRKLKSLGVVTTSKAGGRVAHLEDDDDMSDEA